MKRKLNDKQIEKRNLEASVLMRAWMAPKTEPRWKGDYCYEVDTAVGVYRFGMPHYGGRSVWVFGRFDDPSVAKAHFDCNPFTGKYNHFWDTLTPAETVESLKTLITNLKAYVPAMV